LIERVIQYFKDRIEGFDDYSILVVLITKKEIVIYSMYTIESNNSFIYIIQKLETQFLQYWGKIVLT